MCMLLEQGLVPALNECASRASGEHLNTIISLGAELIPATAAEPTTSVFFFFLNRMRI